MSYRTKGEHLTHLTPACFADLRETLFSNDVGVLPLGETALARQFEISALSGLETSQPRPTMTGPTKTADCRGMKPPHRWDREFPRSPEGARTQASVSQCLTTQDMIQVRGIHQAIWGLNKDPLAVAKGRQIVRL